MDRTGKLSQYFEEETESDAPQRKPSGTGPRCEHGRMRTQCVDCGGSSICEHGKRKSTCVRCGGSSICEHGKRRSRCQHCGGSALCEHGKDKSMCKACGGSSFCEHGKMKCMCVQCGGASICKHGKSKYRCVLCGGKGVCEHGRLKYRCVACGGSSICEHGKRRHLCKTCGGSSICKHGKERRTCKTCWEASTTEPAGKVSAKLEDHDREEVWEPEVTATQRQRGGKKRERGDRVPKSEVMSTGRAVDLESLDEIIEGASVNDKEDFCDLTIDDDEVEDSGPSSSSGGRNENQDGASSSVGGRGERESASAAPEVARVLQRLEAAERKAEEAKRELEELRRQAVTLQQGNTGRVGGTGERAEKRPKLFESRKPVSEASDEQGAMLRERGAGRQSAEEAGSQGSGQRGLEEGGRRRNQFEEKSCTIS